MFPKEIFIHIVSFCDVLDIVTDIYWSSKSLSEICKHILSNAKIGELIPNKDLYKLGTRMKYAVFIEEGLVDLIDRIANGIIKSNTEIIDKNILIALCIYLSSLKCKNKNKADEQLTTCYFDAFQRNVIAYKKDPTGSVIHYTHDKIMTNIYSLIDIRLHILVYVAHCYKIGDCTLLLCIIEKIGINSLWCDFRCIIRTCIYLVSKRKVAL